jgi:hypothetical protein
VSLSNRFVAAARRLASLLKAPNDPSSMVLASTGPMSAQSRIPLAAAALALLSVSCASYPDRTAHALADFQRGHLLQAHEAYEKPATTNSAFLSGAEAGMVSLAAGDWDGTLKDLGAAAKAVEDIEHEALISAENLGETLLTWTLSESAQAYQGEGYERVLVHAGLALAYIAKGNLEDARVEVRQSNALLESEEKLYEKEYKAGGLGHFLSALSYELDGEPDQAWIDYQRMRKKEVGTELAGRALARLAKVMHREDELGDDMAKYADPEAPADAANVVVVAGVGLAPYKHEITLPIPTPSGLLQWSVPAFTDRPQPVSAVELSVSGGDQDVRTVVIEDLGRVAKENLEDRIAWLAAKSAVRAFLKRELTRQLEEQSGLWGRLAGDLFTFVTERADLRSWETLPDTWQAARVFLPPGSHDLHLRAIGGAEVDLGAFELQKGETMFVFARTVDTMVYAYPVGGRRVEPVPAQAMP